MPSYPRIAINYQTKADRIIHNEIITYKLIQYATLFNVIRFESNNLIFLLSLTLDNNI